MNEQIEALSQALVFTLAVFVLVVVAVLAYVCWLLIQLHRDVRRYLRRPEVERDGSGRRIKERV